jgi:hypothetical protein
MNHWLWRQSIYLHRDPDGGARNFEKKVRFLFFQNMCKRRLWKQASLSVGTPLGNLGGRLFTKDFKR